MATKQALSNLYGLMMEINLHQADEDVLHELHEHPDPQIDKHLLKIRQLSTKLKAEANKTHFQTVKEQLEIFKQKGIEELKKLLQPTEQVELSPLFRKFEELTEKDEKAISEDQELLRLMRILKNKLDDNQNK